MNDYIHVCIIVTVLAFGTDTFQTEVKSCEGNAKCSDKTIQLNKNTLLAKNHSSNEMVSIAANQDDKKNIADENKDISQENELVAVNENSDENYRKTEQEAEIRRFAKITLPQNKYKSLFGLHNSEELSLGLEQIRGDKPYWSEMIFGNGSDMDIVDDTTGEDYKNFKTQRQKNNKKIPFGEEHSEEHSLDLEKIMEDEWKAKMIENDEESVLYRVKVQPHWRSITSGDDLMDVVDENSAENYRNLKETKQQNTNKRLSGDGQSVEHSLDLEKITDNEWVADMIDDDDEPDVYRVNVLPIWSHIASGNGNDMDVVDKNNEAKKDNEDHWTNLGWVQDFIRNYEAITAIRNNAQLPNVHSKHAHAKLIKKHKKKDERETKSQSKSGEHVKAFKPDHRSSDDKNKVKKPEKSNGKRRACRKNANGKNIVPSENRKFDLLGDGNYLLSTKDQWNFFEPLWMQPSSEIKDLKEYTGIGPDCY